MFTENNKIMEVGAPIAMANNTDSNSDRIDMTGWDGIVFIATVTDSTNGGTATLKVEQNTIDSDTGMAAITGATVTGTSAADDDLNNKVLAVDVYRPQQRYVQGVRVTATQNGAFGSLIAIQYRGKALAPSEHASIIDIASVVAPAV